MFDHARLAVTYHHNYIINYMYDWAIPFNLRTPPTNDTVCLSQVVIWKYSELFCRVQGVNSTVLGGKLNRVQGGLVGLLPSCPNGVQKSFHP